MAPALAITAGLAALATACGTPASGPGSSPASGGHARTTTTTAPGGSSTTTTSLPDESTCAVSVLRLTRTAERPVGAGTELTASFTNESTASCQMLGYPTPLLLAAGGGQLPTDVVQGGPGPDLDFVAALVPLGPGGSASFHLVFQSTPSPGGTCERAASVEIRPPYDGNHLVLVGPFTVCDGDTVSVSPVYPGR